MFETSRHTSSENISIIRFRWCVGIGINSKMKCWVSAASLLLYHLIVATLERAKFTDISIEQQSIGTACLNNGKFEVVKNCAPSSIQISKGSNSTIRRSDYQN